MADHTSLYSTYNRIPLRFERGEGVWLIAEDGSRFLDFAAGIAVLRVANVWRVEELAVH